MMSTTASTTETPGVPAVSTKATSYVSQSTVVLNGNVNPSGVETSYWYEYGPTSSLGSFTASQLIGGGYMTYAAPTTLTGLAASTVYYYRIAAQNQYGKVYGSVLSFQTNTTPPPPVGDAPVVTTANATSIARTTATLHGQVNPNDTATTYYFAYGQSTTFGLFTLNQNTPTKSAGSGTALASFSANVTGLNPSSTYYYQLVANNQYGTTRGAVYSFTTRNNP